MALDSGIPAGMTVFFGLTGLVYNGERWILGTSGKLVIPAWTAGIQTTGM